ncbi:Uncharacterized protein PBTT_02761 [Plasmodiophora brassicae]|uniref:Uncharacterized protein n=1 Tax=Plasmodiophora brassicae TaxID=37360 RepID=A0A0G4J518_PLABS|nr:hypothetical protein PBRA_008975 [Plasmodiophora brassicae]SPQ95762.1 unnamed protein product [Plasmodiophora brassicae]
MSDVKFRLMNPTSPRHLHVGKAIQFGWEMFRPHALPLMLWALSVVALNVVSDLIARAISTSVAPWTNWAISLLYLPIYLGPFLFASTWRHSGESPNARVLFWTPFRFWLPLVAIHVLTSIATAIGFFLLILPGVYLLLTLAFSAAVYLEYHHDGIVIVDSLVISRKNAHMVFCQVFLLGIASVGILVLGAICFGVGLLAAIPVVALAWADAFDQVIGFNLANST